MDNRNQKLVDAAVDFFAIGANLNAPPTYSTVLLMQYSFEKIIETGTPFIEEMQTQDEPEFMSEEAFLLVMKSIPPHFRLNVIAGGAANILEAATTIYKQ